MVNALMNLEHELVGVRPSLRHGACAVEEVHEHRLPGAHRAVEVDALASLLGGLETTKKRVQDPQDSDLCGVLAETSVVVSLQKRERSEWTHPSP